MALIIVFVHGSVATERTATCARSCESGSLGNIGGGWANNLPADIHPFSAFAWLLAIADKNLTRECFAGSGLETLALSLEVICAIRDVASFRRKLLLDNDLPFLSDNRFPERFCDSISQ
jgi:hypothetical protein